MEEDGENGYEEETEEIGVLMESFLLSDEEGLGLGFDAVDDDDIFGTDEEVSACASTGFLERFLPLCMCLSQYLESGYASFEHLHFLPSVLLHLPGSGSAFLPKPT